MKLKEIELADISRYRGELMGIAILLVVLFHVGLSRSDPFFGLRRMGNIGVDIFFFLSGMGLWYSWLKTPSVAHFYKRRLLRIYPTWLVVATLFYLPDYLGGRKFSSSLLDLIGDITINWDFWIHAELTFWYIPATLMLYVFAPCYMKLIRKHPIYRWLVVAMMAWCIIVQYITPVHEVLGHLEIFWSRVPIFFIGINCGEWVRQKHRLEASSLWLILLLFAMSFASCVYLEQNLHGRFPLFLERMLYIPMTLTGILLLNRAFSLASGWLLRGLTFIGSLSLEVYLIHAHFVLPHLERLGLIYWAKAFGCIVISLPLAWMLQHALAFILKRNTICKIF